MISIMASMGSHTLERANELFGGKNVDRPFLAIRRMPMKDEKVSVNELPDAERQIVADFDSRGIAVSIRKLDGAQVEYSCRARYRADQRDSIVTYGKTPELAVRQTTGNVRGTWPELFEEQDGQSAVDVEH